MVIRHLIPVDDSIADLSPQLVAGGPDEVAYFVVTPTIEPLVDLVAVPTFGDLAGTSIEIASGIDGSGDTDLVPTSAGLAEVGCCGQPGEFVRPSPDSTVHPWVDAAGSPTSSARPTFEIGLRDSAGLTRIDPPTGALTRFEMPGVAVDPRGMPPMVGTGDGGALMRMFDQLSLREYVVRFRTDWPANDVDAADVVLVSQDPSIEVMMLEPAGTVIVRNGARLERRTLEEIGTPGWPGRLERDPTDDWAMTAPGLNEYIDANRPEWAGDPLLLARQLTRRVGPNERVTAAWDEADGVLTITTSGFLDDSVFALRMEIVLERAGDGLFRFVSSSGAQQCQPGRGHQDFRQELCT
jgi:hypothetical protein